MELDPNGKPVIVKDFQLSPQGGCGNAGPKGKCKIGKGLNEMQIGSGMSRGGHEGGAVWRRGVLFMHTWRARSPLLKQRLHTVK